MKITVMRSVYGGYDNPVAIPPQTLEFEEIVVTDVSDPRHHMHSRLAAKHAKCCPWDYTDADMIVWLDGSFEVLRPDWIEFMRDQSEGHLISQYTHPVRDDILIEADVSSTMLKYAGQSVHAQANHYLSLGHPRHWGMWSTGIATYRLYDRELLKAFGNHWLAEQVRWTYQDQISQPHVLRVHDLRPHAIDGDLYNTSYLRMYGHASES